MVEIDLLIIYPSGEPECTAFSTHVCSESAGPMLSDSSPSSMSLERVTFRDSGKFVGTGSCLPVSP